MPDSSLRPNMKLNEQEWNPELRVKVTMTGMRWLFSHSFHNPAETQAARQGAENPFVNHSFTNCTELFCVASSVCACLCVFSTSIYCICICTCWLCCLLSWSCRARRVCKEAKLVLSSVFSWQTLSKRSSSTCSFWVRRSTWKHTQTEILNLR